METAKCPKCGCSGTVVKYKFDYVVATFLCNCNSEIHFSSKYGDFAVNKLRKM